MRVLKTGTIWTIPAKARPQVDLHRLQVSLTRPYHRTAASSRLWTEVQIAPARKKR